MRLIETAASGIRAQQVTIDTIGNNLANVNTPGFKASQVDFAEALATVVHSVNEKNGGNVVAAPLSVGSGVIYAATGTNFQQGTLVPSDQPLDLSISGSGFFEVKTPDGNTGYTRAGEFRVDESGQLTDIQGNIVQPRIQIPLGVTNLSVKGNGEITGLVSGTETVFGQITLAGFSNPEGLQTDGNNLFVPTVNSGAPQVGQPGSAIGNQTLGTIRDQSLEQSNVDLVASMTDLVQAQRAYQMNARLVSDGDQMMGIADTLRR
ncbi:flagellar hook-basal body protein [Desulfosporosinus sp. SB140]|uniref:flagellar hook-basal body protein n=1 Tax=Desulfosporosinus paludis TaxID=3115649 RepID=UPI00388FC0D4